MLVDISILAPRERAQRYGEIAREARFQAAISKPETQIALIKLAGHWEQLAREADAEVKWGT